MKKLKLLSPILAVSAAITPTSLLTSCAKDYSELASFIQQETLAIFQRFSNGNNGEIPLDICHRQTFDCSDIYNFIIKEMQKNNIKPAGLDKWTNIPEVKKELAQDVAYGNVWFDIEPTPGCEDWPAIMLQSHYDMTLQFNSQVSGAKEYWEEHGVTYLRDNEYNFLRTVMLNGAGDPTPDYMSLGADGGMGIAFMMALAESNINSSFKHGAIRLMFTADEGGPTEHFETGADLLNIDSTTQDGYWKPEGSQDAPVEVFDIKANYERPFKHTYIDDEGKTHEYVFNNIISIAALNSQYIYQSTAGMHECIISRELTSTDAPDLLVTQIPYGGGTGVYKYKIKLDGLTGGHSAEDINAGLASALELLFQVLKFKDPEEADEKQKFRIVSLESGNNAYRICNSATAEILTTDTPDEMEIRKKIFENVFKSKYPKEAEKLSLTYQNEESGSPVSIALTNEASNAIVMFANNLIFGPQTWYDEKHEEVKTSLNFCPFTITPSPNGDKVSLSFHVTTRSGEDDELALFSEAIHWNMDQTLTPVGLVDKDHPVVDVKTTVWQQNPKDKLVDMMVQAYKSNKNTAELKNCHGWFEVACLQKELEDPYMVCVGPLIDDAHTSNEVLYFDTLIPVFKGILYVFENAQGLNHEEPIK